MNVGGGNGEGDSDTILPGNIRPDGHARTMYIVRAPARHPRARMTGALMR